MTARPFSSHDRHAALFAVALLLATYAMFSVRTLIDPLDPGVLFDAKRLLATGAGAVSFWFVVTRSKAVSRKDGEPLRIDQVVRLLLAALGPVLAIRIGYDLLVAQVNEPSLARNLRWVLAWSGYCLAAMLGYRVLVLQRAAAARRLADRFFTKPPSHSAAPAEPEAEYEEADPARGWMRER